MRSKEVLLERPTAEGQIQFPLPFIPGPEGRRKQITDGLVHTASHELNHALVALYHGVTVVGITVVRRGNVLGSTRVLAENCSDDTFRAVAAGGSIATHDGSAFGFGSDMLKVEHGKGSASTADIIARANNAISKYSRGVRRKAAEMIAYLKNVSGNMLPLILERAALEFALEAQGIKEPVIAQVYKYKPVEYEESEITTIETYENGDVVVRREEEIKKFCSSCMGIGEHRIDCSVLKSGQNSFEDKESSNSFDSKHQKV